MSNAQSSEKGLILPKHELEAIARCIYPAIVEFFESEEGQREFAEWKAQQKADKGTS